MKPLTGDSSLGLPTIMQTSGVPSPLNPGDRGGSHNLVIGGGNRFTQTAFGGFVASERNTIKGFRASIGGGFFNTASGLFATISGGIRNLAGGLFATVSGGGLNNASGTDASVGGGFENFASGPGAAVTGGNSNSASGSSLPSPEAAATPPVGLLRSCSAVMASPTTTRTLSHRSLPSRDFGSQGGRFEPVWVQISHQSSLVGDSRAHKSAK
jgi:hypothetical protein